MRHGAALDGALPYSARPGHAVDGVRGQRLNDVKASLASSVQFSSRAGTLRSCLVQKLNVESTAVLQRKIEDSSNSLTESQLKER